MNRIAAFTTLLAFGVSCKSGTSNVPTEPPELPVLKITAVDTAVERSYVATINACQNVEIRAKASGYLERILVDEGQLVQKGQLLFYLNTDEARLQLTEATAILSGTRADVRTAQVELERVNRLVAKNVLTRSESELATAKLTAANARVDEAIARENAARLRLSYTSIRAPFSGIIDRIPQKPGSLVTEGSLLTTISDIDKMHVYFNVSENEYLGLVKAGELGNRTGQKVQLRLSDGTTYLLPGKVETVEAEFESGTGSIAFRAGFPNPDRILKHGASGKIVISSSVRDAVLIPQRSVFEIQDKNYVYVVGQDNKAKMKKIIPDSMLEDMMLVRAGLQEGDRIIYEGMQNVREGDQIRPRSTTITK